MNAMSSRRVFVTTTQAVGEGPLSLLAFFAGVVAAVIGIRFNIAAVAALGFIPVAGAIVYWNIKLCAHFFKARTFKGIRFQ